MFFAFICIGRCSVLRSKQMLTSVLCFQGEKVLQNDEFTRDLFRFLQLLCEGHNNGKWHRLICQGKTTFRRKMTFQFRMLHLVQPGSNSRTTVNSFSRREEAPCKMTFNPRLMLCNATKAKLLPESSHGETKHPTLSIKSLRDH